MKDRLIKGAFLDRDGVINDDLNYVYEKRKFVFKKGIFELLTLLSRNNYLIFIITNQSGIARGLFTEKDYKILTDYYLSKINKKGINIEEVYYCPHHPKYSEAPFNNCECRKPKPGLFNKAKITYNIDMKSSLVIGDSLRDLEAGYLSGIKKRILISPEKIKSKFVTHSFKSISECTDQFLEI